MIKGTNAYCKITKITVNENIATVTLLIYAVDSTLPAKSFRIATKDTDTKEINFVDNNIYWIDQVNNYNYDSNNIDTNKHKEIMFTIDISRANRSSIENNHWIRSCYIYLIDTKKDVSETPAWSSDLLALVSDDFEIPEVTDVAFETIDIQTFWLTDNESESEKRGKIKIKFDLTYESEKDFNYNNSNFSAILNIRSLATDNILETKEIVTSSLSLYNEIETTEHYKLGDNFIVELLITNKNDQIIRRIRKIYKPWIKYSNTFIKTKEGVKRVIAFFVNTSSETEHEGEWL